MEKNGVGVDRGIAAALPPTSPVLSGTAKGTCSPSPGPIGTPASAKPVKPASRCQSSRPRIRTWKPPSRLSARDKLPVTRRTSTSSSTRAPAGNIIQTSSATSSAPWRTPPAYRKTCSFAIYARPPPPSRKTPEPTYWILSTHTGHKTTTMARRYARPTANQFERAAAKRQANKPGEES